MIKTICPYCGGTCEITGGPDGNPFNQNRKEMIVCNSCGRIILETDSFKIPEDVIEELLTDPDIINETTLSVNEESIDLPKEEMTIDDIVNTTDIMLKVTAIAEGGGVKRNAEILVPVVDGIHSLGNDYPFGRRDIDRNPPFSLCQITIKGNEISLIGEIFTIKELPKTIARKLVAYGYGYVPWEEIITVTVSIG